MIWWINYLGIWKGMWGLWNPTPKKKLWLEVDISDKYSWASLAIFISGKSWFFSKLTAHNRFICCDPPLYTGHDTLTISWILKIQMRIEYLNDIYLAITLFNLTKMQKLVQQCRVASHSVWKSSLKVSFVNKSQIFEKLYVQTEYRIKCYIWHQKSNETFLGDVPTLWAPLKRSDITQKVLKFKRIPQVLNLSMGQRNLIRNLRTGKLLIVEVP